MNCIIQSFELFKTNTCQAATIAAVAFVAGIVVACIMCLLRRGSCSCSRTTGARMRRQDSKPFEKRKPHPAPTDGSVEIYVGNLSYEMTETELRSEFEAFGTVASARLITNKYNGKSKGFGFVNMPVRAEAEKACAALNDKEILGRRMKCNEAKNLI